MKFNYTDHTPTPEEFEMMNYVKIRREQMNTNYRKELISAAQWSRKEYDSIPEERINNLDLFKTGLSRAVVNHRLVMMYDNPSEAVYRTVEDSDGYKVDKLIQVDKHDKKVSRFAAIQQQIQRTAEIEGTAISRVEWQEKEDENGVTVGEPSTLTEPIPIEDFYWDEAGIFLNGNSALTCNDAGYGQVMSMATFRGIYDNDEDYSNVGAVRPWVEFPDQEVFNQGWLDENFKGFSTEGDYVYVFTYFIKQYHDNGKVTDKELVIANGQLLYNGKMREPSIGDEKYLPFFKIEGIPTGNFGGIGIPTLIRHPQEALDRMLTMTEAQAELSVNPVLFYQATGELMPDTIDYYPGAAYPYKGTGAGITNDLQFFQQPDITNGAQWTIEKMMEMITIVSGVDIRALTAGANSELATQTQNKQEIQEKILKMSVLWNESHGWADLAIIRMAYLQEYFPVMRIRRVLGKNGKFIKKTDYPTIKVEGYSVKKGQVKGKSVDTLIKETGAYSSMSIRPEDLRFNVDVYIESSQIASGVDAVKQNKWDKTIDSLARVPGIENLMDAEKVSKNTIKYGGFKPSEILLDKITDIADTAHPARKEFKAILMSDIIPFEPIIPKDYNPEDYIFVFKDMQKLPEYKDSNDTVKKLVQERFQLHMLNFADPYFAEKQKMVQEQQQQDMVEGERQAGKALKPIGGSNEQPTSLMGRTKSTAAKMGAK